MRRTLEEKRLRAIKSKLVIFPTECHCCREEVSLEKMWYLWRYGINKTVYKMHFCKNCMNTPQDVLNEIDTDSNPFGIAYVDDFNTLKKKDYTGLNVSIPVK